MSTQLQQQGWEISAEQDYHACGLRVALRHQSMRMYGISESIYMDYFRYTRHTELPPIRIQYMASDLTVNIMDDLSRFRPIDAMPQVDEIERKSIEDFSIFATPLVRTEEIIIEPETVAECLEIIKRIQKPEQDAIREKKRLYEARENRRLEAVPRQRFHAQILSIV